MLLKGCVIRAMVVGAATILSSATIFKAFYREEGLVLLKECIIRAMVVGAATILSSATIFKAFYREEGAIERVCH